MTYTKLADSKIIDAHSGAETIVDVGIDNGLVNKIGDIPDARADKIYQIGGRIVAPSLIDIHTHVYHLGTSLGVDADSLGWNSGVDIFVDAGSAGAGNFLGFRKHIIEKSKVKIYCFLNIGFGGIPFFGIGNRSQIGEIPDLLVADEERCAECISSNLDIIVGIKVRLSEKANGQHDVKPLLIAKKVANKFGLPVMAHFGRPPPKISDILPHLKKGDILTHSFRPEPNSILDSSGSHILELAKEARKRGVWIDTGHGNGSFSFSVARSAINDGFLPDIISTDVHQLSVPFPVYDLPTTMSKLLNLGMPLNDVILSVTRNPAMAIGRDSEHGLIEEGRLADLIVFDVENRSITVSDTSNQELTMSRIIRPSIRVKEGEASTIDYVPIQR